MRSFVSFFKKKVTSNFHLNLFRVKSHKFMSSFSRWRFRTNFISKYRKKERKNEKNRCRTNFSGRRLASKWFDESHRPTRWNFQIWSIVSRLFSHVVTQCNSRCYRITKFTFESFWTTSTIEKWRIEKTSSRFNVVSESRSISQFGNDQFIIRFTIEFSNGKFRQHFEFNFNEQWKSSFNIEHKFNGSNFTGHDKKRSYLEIIRCVQHKSNESNGCHDSSSSSSSTSFCSSRCRWKRVDQTKSFGGETRRKRMRRKNDRFLFSHLESDTRASSTHNNRNSCFNTSTNSIDSKYSGHARWKFIANWFRSVKSWKWNEISFEYLRFFRPSPPEIVGRIRSNTLPATGTILPK